MERIFQTAAVILAGIAAYFLYQGNSDGAFVSAVLGAVAFFISFRFQVKERLKKREAEAEQLKSQLEENPTKTEINPHQENLKIK